jgi:hypothetical protein
MKMTTQNGNQSIADHRAHLALSELLDSSLEQINTGLIDGGLSTLMTGLWQLRQGSELDRWHHLIHQGRRHPICTVLLHDPMTEWAFRRPRGYPGDAILLDHTYEVGDVVRRRLENATALGRNIYRWLVTYSGIIGLKERRRHMAALLDETAEDKPHAKVLSIACGHGREMDLSAAMRSGCLHFTGLDQDEESLRTLHRDYDFPHVSTEAKTVKELIKDQSKYFDFDLVYSMGLFDYLPDNLAQVFLHAMVSMVKPGGRVVIANGLKGVLDTGYIEMFMDWHLIYRTEEELTTLLSRVPSGQIQNSRVFSQASGHFGYLEVLRA